MGKTLGINDDYWHLLIPLSIYIVLVPLLFHYCSATVAMVSYLVVYLALGLIQFMYEWLQAVDSMVEVNYGSFEVFQENSKRDIKFFIIGTFLGTFIGIITYGVLEWLIW